MNNIDTVEIVSYQIFFLYISTIMSSDIRAAMGLLSASMVYMNDWRPCMCVCVCVCVCVWERGPLVAASSNFKRETS